MYGVLSTAEDRDYFIAHNNLAFLQNGSEKLRLWCLHRHKSPPQTMRRIQKRKSIRKYLPAITTNLRKHPASRKVLKVAGCGPYCKYRERRELICQTCFLRFHVECVRSTLLQEKEGKNYLPECQFCERNRINGWGLVNCFDGRPLPPPPEIVYLDALDPYFPEIVYVDALDPFYHVPYLSVFFNCFKLDLKVNHKGHSI